MDPRALMALVSEAARDPSGARRLLELADAMLTRELEQPKPGMPPGYMYAGASSLVAFLSDLAPEPLPAVQPNLPLTQTANPPFRIRIPFDCLVQGVSGWAITEQVPVALNSQLGQLKLNVSPSGRDLFSVGWELEGDRSRLTDGERPVLEPAVTVLGTRKRPRELGWKLQRDQIVRVYARNLTNLILPGVLEGQTEGWIIHVVVAFNVLNMEIPK